MWCSLIVMPRLIFVISKIEKKIRENYAQAFDKSLSDELVNAADDDE